MKKYFYLLVFLIILVPNLCFSASINLAWQESASSGIVKYRLYISLISGLYAKGYDDNARVIIDSSSDCWTTATIEGLTPGLRYYFVVSAVNSNGLESDFSNEVAITIGVDNPNPTSTEFVNPAPPVLLAMVDMKII